MWNPSSESWNQQWPREAVTRYFCFSCLPFHTLAPKRHAEPQRSMQTFSSVVIPIPEFPSLTTVASQHVTTDLQVSRYPCGSQDWLHELATLKITMLTVSNWGPKLPSDSPPLQKKICYCVICVCVCRMSIYVFMCVDECLWMSLLGSFAALQPHFLITFLVPFLLGSPVLEPVDSSLSHNQTVKPPVLFLSKCSCTSVSLRRAVPTLLVLLIKKEHW